MIRTGEEARKVLLNGIRQVAETVSSTLGPYASTALFKAPSGRPVVVDDGVSIIRQIKLDDPFEELGASLMREVAEEAQKASGDGTTSAMVMALAMAQESFRLVQEDSIYTTPRNLKTLLDRDLKKALSLLREGAIEVTDDDLVRVATLSANGDEVLGNIIAEAFICVGEGGTVFVKDGLRESPELELIEGMKAEAGATTPYLLKGQREIKLNDCLVAVTDEMINDFSEVVQALNHSVETKRPIIIFCTEISQAALDNLTLNVVQGKVNAMVVKLPGMGSSTHHTAQDIAIRTGATCLSSGLGERIKDIELNQLGGADGIFTETKTVLTRSPPETDDDVASREEELIHEMDYAEHEWDKKVLQGRIANLRGRVATITVCADTDTETIEMKTRMDDAINATRAALKGGVIAGGGISLSRVAERIPEGIIQMGLVAVQQTLAKNAGVSVEEWGYSMAASDEGIIDPLLVVENSVKTAASIAGLVLTTDLLIVGE